MLRRMAGARAVGTSKEMSMASQLPETAGGDEEEDEGEEDEEGEEEEEEVEDSHAGVQIALAESTSHDGDGDTRVLTRSQLLKHLSKGVTASEGQNRRAQADHRPRRLSKRRQVEHGERPRRRQEDLRLRNARQDEALPDARGTRSARRDLVRLPGSSLPDPRREQGADGQTASCRSIR